MSKLGTGRLPGPQPLLWIEAKLVPVYIIYESVSEIPWLVGIAYSLLASNFDEGGSSAFTWSDRYYGAATTIMLDQDEEFAFGQFRRDVISGREPWRGKRRLRYEQASWATDNPVELQACDSA